MPKKRTVTLYRGNNPTPSQLRFRNMNLPVIAVDETGDMGIPKPDSGDRRQSFTVVASLIWDRKEFVKAAEAFPKGKRAKYNSMTLEECGPVFEILSTQRFIFSEVHRSRRNPCFRDTPSKVDAYVEMISQVILENDPGIPHDIVIDRPPVEALECLVDMCSDMVRNGREVVWFEIRSSSADHVLQVHDFVTGSAGDCVEGIADKMELYEVIEDKHRRRE